MRYLVGVLVIGLGCGGGGNAVDAGSDGPSDGAAIDAPPDGAQPPVACPPMMAPRITLPGHPSGVAVADVDGDGKRDLVVTTSGNPSATPPEPAGLAVLHGNGDGTFQPAVLTVIDPDAQLGPASPVIVDVDGDGDLDVVLALSRASASAVQTVLNDGSGAFELGPRLAGSFVTSIGAGDLDGNGQLDLVTASLGITTGVAIHLGTGGGNFAAPVALDAGSAYDSVAVVDLDGDQLLDLVAASATPSAFGELAVFGGHGNGVFDAPVKQQTVSDYATQVVAGDLNGDGVIDLVSAGWRGADEQLIVESWLGAGTATFTHHSTLVRLPDHKSSLPPPNEFSGFRGVPALGDLDGDGKLEVVVTFQNRNVLGVIPGTGTGDLTTFTELAMGDAFADGPVGLGLTDLDGDGRLDAVVPEGIDRIEIALGSATTTFRAPRGLPSRLVNQGIPFKLAVGDLDGDGKLDFTMGVVSPDGEPFMAGVFVVRSSVNELPRFAFLPDDFFGHPEHDQVRLRDLDGDGDLDLVIAADRADHGWLSVFPNNGSGLFGPQVDQQVGMARDLAIGDLDGDDRPELVLVAADPSSTAILSTTVYANSGTGVFTAHPSFTSQRAVLLVDVNHDGKLDLITSGSAARITVQLGNGDGSFGTAIETTMPAVVQHLVVADLDGDGTPDLGADTIALHGNGDGTFIANGTLPAPPGGLLALADLDGIAPIDVAGATGAIYRAGSASLTVEWTINATELRDVTGDGHPDAIGLLRQANTAFVLSSQCP